MEVNLEIFHRFKKLIEDNHICHLLYNEDGIPRSDTTTQLVFYLGADCYWSSNNIDLNRECDPGCGELDFKLFSGYNVKLLIEIKLSFKTRQSHGLTKQLLNYQAAECTPKGILLIIRFDSEHNKRI